MMKLFIISSLVLGIIFLLLGLALFWLVQPTFASLSYASVKEKVNLDNLRSDVAFLTEITPPRHSQNLDSLSRAADYIKQQFEKSGYDVSYQNYQVEGETYFNLLTGIGPENAPKIIIGAHYDVCGDQPGADDNASGVAGLLELARLFAIFAGENNLSNRIEFVAYSLEEPPHFRTQNMGSAVHARSLKEKGVDIELMISLEMIGYFSDVPGSQSFPLSALGYIYPKTGNFITVIGNLGGGGVVRKLKTAMQAATPLAVWSMNAPSAIPGIDFSDHLNYWAQGYPAVMITDTSFYRNPNYHEASDTIDTLDFKRMRQVVLGVYNALKNWQK